MSCWTKVLIAATLTLAAVPAAVRADVWQKLGSRQVSYRAERDVIVVSGAEGLFKAIRLDVDDGNLEMYNIRVVFGDRQVFSPDTRLIFREDSRSRTIDLPGNVRLIRRVEFFYRSRGRKGMANIDLFGLRADAVAPVPAVDGAGAMGVSPAGVDFTGWRSLGSRMVGFGVDHDAISGLGDGTFRQIMLVVEDADLELFNVRVVFGNGKAFSPETRLYFKEGSRSRVIDLPAGSRVIQRVDFSYRSVAGGGDGRATVQLWGK
jgi:hypothetical protein